jgi:uncharacterized protein (TIGR02145 family)
MKTRNIFGSIIFIIIIFSIISCKKDEAGKLPTVLTYIPKYIASKSATLGIIVDPDGDGDFICGIYVSASPNPETTGTQFQIGNQPGTFLGQILGLTPETEYYVKAYVKNADEEKLAEEKSFTTPALVYDYDNNEYETIIMGDQQWMGSNLKTAHYLNGDIIETTDPATLDITGESSPKYQWSYSGDDANTLIYGKLYTFYAISDSRKVCPAGWHIPSDTEWTTLEATLGGFESAGSKLKEMGNMHWIAPYNTDATNESLFTALPGGSRNNTGQFVHKENYGYFWSSTESNDSNAWLRTLYVQSLQVIRDDFEKNSAVSVRCLKDD